MGQAVGRGGPGPAGSSETEMTPRCAVSVCWLTGCSCFGPLPPTGAAALNVAHGATVQSWGCPESMRVSAARATVITGFYKSLHFPETLTKRERFVSMVPTPNGLELGGQQAPPFASGILGSGAWLQRPWHLPSLAPLHPEACSTWPVLCLVPPPPDTVPCSRAGCGGAVAHGPASAWSLGGRHSKFCVSPKNGCGG